MFFRRKQPVPLRANDLESDDAFQTNPIVVGGSGRSGTTLMRVMLDTHSRICAGPESWLFTPREIDVPALAGKFDLPESDVRSMAGQADSRADFIQCFFDAYCAAARKPRWAEKTPANIESIPFIFRAFPNVCFVEMVRDGRDVACSMRTHPRHKVVDGELVPLNTWNPLGQCIDRWVRAIETSRPFWDDARYLRVRYEDLVLRTEETLKMVFAFIGESYEPEVVHYHEVRSGSRKIEKFPQNPEATKPVSESAIGRWVRDLDEKDRTLFKERAGDLLVELGYERSSGW